MRSWKKPTPEQVEKAIARLVYAEHYRYFFDRLENPVWLEPLWKKGFFKRPPQPEQDEEEGTDRFPPWPEARYLKRMAKHKPKLVAEIIQSMDDTENVAVLLDLVDALLAMPPEVSARLVEKAKRWAEIPYLLLPEKLGQLISHLGKGGRTEEAMAIARVLLDILPDPRQRQVPGPNQPSRLLPEPLARFDTWRYEEILRKHYPELVRAAGFPALELLCDLLDKAIRFSRHGEDDQGTEDYSSIWRPAVEDHAQDLSHTTKDALVTALRDAAELLVQEGRATVEDVVGHLEQKRWKIFRRIALHLLRVFPGEAKALAAARLTDRSLFEDVGLRHEYVLLLRDRFGQLSREHQATILRWVEEGPDVNRWEERHESERGQLPSVQDVTRYREIWQRDWLARIGLENLPPKWRERYQTLIKKYGKPEHPELPVYREVRWVGPASPKTADELKSMSVSEVVEFLKTWKPSQNLFGEPSPKGLGRVLKDVVAEKPEVFAAEARSFQGLDPTYVRALVTGLREAVRQGKAFDWEPVLDLCEWVLSQPCEIPGRQVREMEADPHWGWTRKEIAHLLSAGLEDGSCEIPIELRKRVWDVLRPLTDDPDPTPEDEQRYGGPNMDPATLSINTTRGEAMHAVIRYALWVRRHLEKVPGSEARLQKGFDEMPEVREVLETHLDPVREPSLAIRSVYGRWFPWLVLLDPDWARAHVEKIFPQDQESEAFFEAAWNTYIVFCRPYDNVWDVLKPQYRLAVDRIGRRHDDTRWLGDPDEKLAEHLMAFYWRGKLLLNDPLFGAFWDKAPDAVRAHAMAFIGRALTQTEGEIPEVILTRLKQLWEWRLDVTKKAERAHDFKKEIAAFGWWFVTGKFDIDWALDQLLESLQVSRRTEPVDMVLETLAGRAKTHSLKSVRCLHLIAKGDWEGWELYVNREHIRRILQLSMKDPIAKQDAERVIHYLGSRGFLEFRELLWT